MKNQTSKSAESKKLVNKTFGYTTEYIDTFKKKMSIDFKKEIEASNEMFAPKVYDIQKAYSKLIEMWNKDIKARNFVKHLTMGFLPVDPLNKVISVDSESACDLKCAILNYQLAGLSEISKLQAKLGTDVMLIKSHALADNRKLSDQEIRDIKGIQEEYPIYIRKCMFAYFSKKSNKYLSNPAMYALTYFVDRLLINNYGDELISLVKRNAKKETEEAKQLETQKPAAFALGDTMDVETLNKLKSFKDE